MRMCHIFSKVIRLKPNFIGFFLMMRLALPCIWFSNWMHGLVGKQGSVLLTHTRMGNDIYTYVSCSEPCELHVCLAIEVKA